MYTFAYDFVSIKSAEVALKKPTKTEHQEEEEASLFHNLCF